jgi:drug/metabolite transporter (DMT)-like permease
MSWQRGMPLLLVFVALAWAGSFVVVKAITVDVDPIFLGFLRFIVATPLMILVLLVQKKKLIWERKLIPWMAVLGLTGVTFLYIFQFMGISLTTAATAGVLINTNVLFIALLSVLFIHEKLTRKRIIGILLSFTGAIIVIWSRSTDGTFIVSDIFIIGSILVVLSAFCWAIYSIIGKKLLKDYDMVEITTTAFLWGTIFYLPVIPYLSSSWTHISLLGWGAVFYLAVICSVFGYLGWYYALKHIDASKAAVYLNLIPLFTIFLALIFGEVPSPFFLVGAGLIIYGVYLTQHG